MTHDKTGGPAFPQHSVTLSDDGVTLHESVKDGMTLRQYAAIHADLSSVEFESVDIMASFVGEPAPDQSDVKAVFELAFRAVAKLRYMSADAMLKERERE